MSSRPRISGHFLDAPHGRLAVTVWEPPATEAVRFCVLHVPAAFEEMNKSRRTVASQARAFAARGGRVAVLDLFGTGDSDGEHGDATWERWQADVVTAWTWLGMGNAEPRILWGLRLGGLLAIESASSQVEPDALLLWQPVLSARTFFNQFFRIATVQQATGGAAVNASPRQRLERGCIAELAGYDVHPDLVAAPERLDVSRLPPPACPVVWRETAVGEGSAPSLAAGNLAGAWSAAGVSVDIKALPGPSFWTTQEIAEFPSLVESTCRAVAAVVGQPRRPVALSA